jgi:hypothetical protein
MCVCVCVCVHTHIIYIHTHTHIHIHTYIYTYDDAKLPKIHSHAYTYKHLYTHTYTCNESLYFYHCQIPHFPPCSAWCLVNAIQEADCDFLKLVIECAEGTGVFLPDASVSDDFRAVSADYMHVYIYTCIHVYIHIV